MEISNLSWHDGILNGYTFNPNYEGVSEVIIHLELYPEQLHAKERDKFKIICKVVESFKLDTDIGELKKNKTFGNINHGEISEQLLKIELFGGVIEIKANEYTVSQC